MATILLILTLYTLTVARITRLLTADKLTDWIREELIRWRGIDSLSAYLFHCRWCMSVWVAFALAPAAVHFTHLDWWLIPFIAFPASHATGLLVRAEPGE